MEAKRFAIISDTHGLLRPEVRERLKTCEGILHAGDFDKPDILRQLEEICPVYAVRGNADGNWAKDLPEEREIILAGFRIRMIHNRKALSGNLSGVDIVVCGHSHKYGESREDGVLYLNPGSCGPRRFRLPVTMMVATLYPAEHRIETERVECGLPDAAVRGKTEENSAAGGEDPLQGRDLHKLVKRIMKEVRAGRTVEEIAARNCVDVELAEQICRFYVTHPGVDVDGILNRMELRARSRQGI